jgi:hypothetical protein
MTYWESRKLRATNYLIANKELITLIVLSCVTAAFFVYEGFATDDSVRYALGLQSINEKGIAEIAHAFHGEMSFGYYLLLGFLAKLVGDSVSLSNLMNNFNAAISVVLLCSLFLFFDALCSDRKLSFFACLMVMLSPSIWFLSHYGHPALLSLAFFIDSLFVYDRIICGRRINQHSGLLWLVFILLSTIALATRLNNALAYGVCFGLLHFRHALSIRTFCKTFGVLIVVLFLVFGLSYFVLGYLMNPLENEIAPHVANRLGGAQIIIRNVVKNCVLWAMSANVLIVLLAGLGVIRLGLFSRLGVLLISWITPWCIFLPFGGIDFSRIAAPTIPIISLAAAAYVTAIFKRRQVLALGLVLILAQGIAVAMYYPLVRIYPFTTEIDGRVLAEIPLGFLPEDHYCRQRAINAYEHIAELVTSERDANVFIVGGGGLMRYRFWLGQSGNVVLSEKFTSNGVELERYMTAENELIILNLYSEPNRGIKDPIRRTIGYVNDCRTEIHFVPFWREYPRSEGELFLANQDIQLALDHETAILEEGGRTRWNQ